MGLRGPVLCATDLSAAADASLREGYAISTQIGAAFIACHVLPEAYNVRVLFPHESGIDTSFQAELSHKASAAVRAQLDRVIGEASHAVRVEIDTGTTHAGILTVAQRVGAGIIMVGPGGTALRIARSSDVPVLVAKPSPTGGGVLGATDFSDPSLPAVTMAVAESRRRGVRLRLVHCLDVDATAYVAGAGLPGGVVDWPMPPALVGQLEVAARQRLAAVLGGTSVEAEALVVRGAPATGILEAAERATTGLIVVGTRGRTGLARLALGSVAESVMTRAACSVLVVPLHPV